MSIVSSLNRQNRVYTATVQTPAADGTSTILYASIGNFPNSAKINQVKVTLSSGTLTNPTVYILNNGAKHKKAPTALFPTTAVRVATTEALPSDGAIIYANGAAGVGATLTKAENGTLGNIDGVNVQVGDRILVKNQVTTLQNGIYTVTSVGSGGSAYVLTRATDADTATTEMRYGLSTAVTSGSVNAGLTYFMNNSAAITMGTTGLTWVVSSSLADSYVEGTGTGTASGQSATVVFNPAINWANTPHSDCFNIAASMAGPIPSGGKFTFEIEYTPLQEFKYPYSDETPIVKNTHFRVLRQPSAGNATDLTVDASQNFNPYGLGADNNSLSFLALNATTDNLYIGSTKKFSRILIHPHASNYIGAGISLTVEYWNGSSWVAVPFLWDNTSDQQGTPSTMSYAGTVEFAAGANWTPYKLSTDPMTVYENDILAGNAYPPGMMVHPDRYYVRLRIGSLAAPLRLVKAVILKD